MHTDTAAIQAIKAIPQQGLNALLFVDYGDSDEATEDEQIAMAVSDVCEGHPKSAINCWETCERVADILGLTLHVIDGRVYAVVKGGEIDLSRQEPDDVVLDEHVGWTTYGHPSYGRAAFEFTSWLEVDLQNNREAAALVAAAKAELLA